MRMEGKPNLKLPTQIPQLLFENHSSCNWNRHAGRQTDIKRIGLMVVFNR